MSYVNCETVLFFNFQDIVNVQFKNRGPEDRQSYFPIPCLKHCILSDRNDSSIGYYNKSVFCSKILHEIQIKTFQMQHLLVTVSLCFTNSLIDSLNELKVSSSDLFFRKLIRFFLLSYVFLHVPATCLTKNLSKILEIFLADDLF